MSGRVVPRSASSLLLTGIAAMAILTSAEPARSQDMSFGWSISASSTDPYTNHIEYPGAGLIGYLWFLCAPVGSSGMLSSEFNITMSGLGNSITMFFPANGFVNEGSATDLQLTVNGCPTEPIMAGLIFASLTEPGNLCLAGPQGGAFTTQDCGSPPLAPDTWRGLDFGGEFCHQGTVCSYVDAPIPCCLPDGTCREFPAIHWEESCLGSFGYGPPVQFCFDWDCEPISGASEPWRAEPWGRIKARYHGR